MKQQQHHNFLEIIAKNRNFIQKEQNSLDCKEVMSEEVDDTNMIPQSKLDVTIQEITFAVAAPFINEKKQQKEQPNTMQNNQINEYWKRRRLRQKLCQKEWMNLNQFCEKKKREIDYQRRKQQLRKEKQLQLRKEKQEQIRKEKVQEKNHKQSKLNITFMKQKYKKLKSTSPKTNYQFTNRQKHPKYKLQNKRLDKEVLINKKVTLSQTQELILGLAVYLGILQTSFIESCLPISQSQAKQYFLENVYKIMLLSRDLLANYKKKLVCIYSQPNKYLIQLFQLCMQKNGLTLDDIIEECNEMPEYPSLHNSIYFPNLYQDQIRQCDKK